MITVSIGGKTVNAEPAPTKGSLIATVKDRLAFEETVKANWLACVATFADFQRLRQKLDRIDARLVDPAFAQYDWRHPFRIEAEQVRSDLARQCDEAIYGNPSSTETGGLQHQLACFVGLIGATCDAAEQASWASAIAGWNEPDTFVLLHAIHGNPDLVEHQPLWHAVMARFEALYPFGAPTWWSDQRALADWHTKPITRITETEFHDMYRAAINPVAVPF